MTGNGRVAGIVIGDDLQLLGRSLKGDSTLVRIGNVDIEPPQLSESKISLPLKHASLRAGDQQVQVIHRWLMGRPPTPRRGPVSNQVRLRLRPKIIGAITVSGKKSSNNGLVAAQLAVTISPTVGKDQEVNLFLNELPQKLSSTNPISYVFSAPQRAADTDKIRFSVDRVKSGNYLARIEVDGAQTLLSMTDGKYSDPKVRIAA